MSDEKSLSRRKFLQYTGAAAGAAAVLGGAGGLGGTIGHAAESGSAASAPAAGVQAHAANPANPLNRGRLFLSTNLEFDTLSEACERIFPADANGPGAKDLGAPYFIDNQLAAGWGYNAREYTDGPHFEGAATQGYQSPLVRNQMFKQGLAALNEAAQTRFQLDFPKLSGEQMDQILTDCEAGKLPTQGFTSAFFFSLLRDATLGGIYADPIYNGNNNMDGWRLKNYPGAQMAYTYLMQDEKFQQVPPISLSSM